MPETIVGIPAHPLFIHAAVAFLPTVIVSVVLTGHVGAALVWKGEVGV
ncbi:hypothetical protein [Corynebacterium auriscanis]|nr:hypothetical protein [Corynebacterium auriscanis]